MGVMSCSRDNCSNIMCDTYVETIGYICADCKNEFENKYKDKEFSKTKYLKKLSKFIDTPKLHSFNNGNNGKISVYELW